MKDTAAAQTMNGAQAIVANLEVLGVSDVFGMPGGAILPTYDPLMSLKLHHILVCHEQGAAHAAEGCALASGKVGYAIVISGPGVTNTLTAITDANMDPVPIVVVSGQVDTPSIEADALQEVDIAGVATPLAKHSSLVTDPKDIPSRVAEAFIIASSGRPGSVLVDVTRPAQIESLEFPWPPVIDFPGFKLPVKPHKKQVHAAAETILSVKALAFYVGGGMIRASASQDLARLVDATNASVVTTLTARGAFPDPDRRSLGMPGMHSTIPAMGALQRAGLVIALGVCFDDRVAGRLDSFTTGAKVVCVDIDAAEISKNRYADVPIVGDLAEATPALIIEITALKKKHKPADISQWWAYLERLREEYPLGWGAPEDGMMAPQEALEKFSKIVGPEAIYVAGVGQYQMWVTQLISYEEPRHFLSSCELGTMGYCTPAATGTKVVQPDTVVWVIDGDGSFQTTNQELVTCSINKIPIKVCLISNSALDMVRQWQNLFYGQRHSHTTLNPDEGEQIPNFEMLATAYGMAARTVRPIDEVNEVTEWAMSISDRPILIDFRVSKESMVWPMIAVGVSNDETRYARDMAPDWDLED